MSKSFLLIAIISFLSSCSDSEDGSSQNQGYISKAKASHWNSKAIQVCWESVASSPHIDQYKYKVEQFVSAQYARAGLSLLGWKNCNANSLGMRVALIDNTPYVKNFGAYLNGLKNGVNISFTFSKGGYSFCKLSQYLDKCIMSYALHEFGHALALRHEMNRPDATCPDKQVNGESGALAVGPYDPKSIMNYCQIYDMVVNNQPIELSPGDISTLHYIYGSGTVSGPKSSIVDMDPELCLSLNGAFVLEDGKSKSKCLIH